MRRPLTDVPSRVLLTADAVGGVWAHTLELAREYRSRGIETTLAVLGPNPTPAHLAEAALIEGLRLRVTGLPLEWLAATSGEVEAGAQGFAELVREVDPEVVHLHHPALAAAGVIDQPLVTTLHSCLATWWRTMRGAGPLPADVRWRVDLVRRGLSRADVCLAPSDAFARLAASCYPGIRFVVVPNGRRPPPWVEGPRQGVVTTGRLWDEGKDLATLDAAAARLPFAIQAAGPVLGPAGNRFEPAHLALLGTLDAAAVQDLLARSAVYVSTSRFEPFGLGVLEAAQAGCALVLADIPTFRELWAGAALLVRPGDPASLARALAEAVDGAARLGALARARGLGLTAERMATTALGAYRAPTNRLGIRGVA